MLVPCLYLISSLRFFTFVNRPAIDVESIFRTLPIILIHQPFGAYDTRDMECPAYQKYQLSLSVNFYPDWKIYA